MGAHAGPLAALAAVLPEIGANIESGHYLDSDLFETLCEYFRTRGQSGLINTRHYSQGGAKAYHRPGIVGYAAHNIHDHPDHQALAGMAEISACINGIFLRTRHNDYALRAPVAGGTYLQTAEIPLPPVPPSVLALPTVQEQVEEMRQYFLAFANADVELRDYEPYFRFSLSYLEVWAEVLSDTIGDTFNSDRHQINVNNLYAAIAKHTMYSVSGHQDRPENTPHIPFIVRFTDNNGRPKWALIRYRICAVDIGDVATYAPGAILAYRDQFALRHAANLSADQLFRDRRCRFELAQTNGYQFAPTLLDELMAKVPGLNGGGTLAETFNDTGTPYNTKQFGSNVNDLNAAYYNRMFSVFFTASGRSNVRRGWNDPMLFVAATTRPEVAPALDPTMSNAERRYSYAIPLELILRTPLEAWNPHGVVLQSTITGDGLSAATAWTGWKQAAYNYRVPQAFYTGGTVGDPADTGGNARWVLDSGGQAVQCRASGLYVLMPPIQGIANPIRLRYPIAPCYDEGSYEWGYQQALQEELSAMFGSPNPFNSGGPIVTPGAGAGLVFDAPLIASIVPRRGDAPTFTRATSATVVDHEGVIRYAKSGEARFYGARRVENLAPASEDAAGWSLGPNVTTTSTTEAGTPSGAGNTVKLALAAGSAAQFIRHQPCVNGRAYSLRMFAKKGTHRYVGLRLGNSGSQHAAFDFDTGTWVAGTSNVSAYGHKDMGGGWWLLWARQDSATGLYSSICVTDSGGQETWNAAGTETIYITGMQTEEITGQAYRAPSEYVSRGVLASPWHGAGVDGVKYFDTLNGNVVSANVISEAQGASLNSITNLCLQSEDAATSWTKSGATVTANAITAPNSSVTGDKLVEGSSTGQHYMSQTITKPAAVADDYTFSMYVKAGERNRVQVVVGDTLLTAYRLITINLSDGSLIADNVVGSGWTKIGAAVVNDCGGGWYRVSGSFRCSTESQFVYRAYLGDGASFSYTGDGTSGAYVWGMQLTKTSSVAPYIPTTTAAVTRDFALGYVSEDSRTNVMLRSEEFDDATWSKTLSTVTANAITAPDGRSTADKLVEDTSGGQHDVRQNRTAGASLPYSLSVYAKAGERSIIRVYADDLGSNVASVKVNLATGSIHTAASGTGFTAIGADVFYLRDGWYRIVLRFTSAAGVTTLRSEFVVCDETGAHTYTGDGSSGLYLWGAQLEQAHVALSYIPTTTANAVRNKDLLLVSAGAAMDAQGSAYGELTRVTSIEASNGRLIGANASGSPSPLFLNVAVPFGIWDGSTAQNPGGGGMTVGELAKGASTWGAAGRSVSARGNVWTTAAFDGSIAPGGQFLIGNGFGVRESAANPVRNIKLWKKVLPPAQLQAMTA